MGKICYAYKDKYGILHATEDKETAKQYAVGEITEYEGLCLGGFPAVKIEFVAYSDGRIFLGGNEKNGVEIHKLPGALKGYVDREVKLCVK